MDLPETITAFPLAAAFTLKIFPKFSGAALKPIVYATGIIAAFWCVESISGFR